VPQSNVLRIITAGNNATTATEAADTVARALENRIAAGRNREQLLRTELDAYRTLSSAVADAQTRQDLARTRVTQLQGTAGGLSTTAGAAAQQEYRDATADLIPLQLQLQVAGQNYQSEATKDTSAGVIQLIGNAAITGSDASARAARYGVAGGVVGFAVALALALTLSDRRRAPARRAARRRGLPGPAGL
jgi:hypothetical protein